MKKISSKIIISFLLAIFLFGGVGFGVGKDNNNLTVKIGVEKVLAAGGAEACGPEPVPADPSAPAYITWRKCVADAAAGIAAEKLETNGWFQFKQTFKNMPGVFADKAVKTAVAVVGGFLQLIIIPVLGVILRIMAALLDQSIQFALNSVHISDVNDSIVIVWALIRNIFNITFIFILLWSAIQTIVGVASANAKKVIANVIIAALLINFSLFITRILIDAGNILATNMYNLATTNTTGSYVSISTTIMNIMGISGLFASTGADSIFSTSFFIVSVLQVITITTAIITLSYVMMLMLVRNVMLIFLLVLSPIGFMGSVIPKIEEYSKMWWENLYGQVFVAPIFLIFFYLITIIGNKLTNNLSAMMVTGDSGTGTTTVSSSGDYVQYFKYILIIILLFAAVKITKKMSGVVGEMAGKVGSFAVGAALGAATGGLAMAGRGVVGRIGAGIADSDRVKGWAANNRFGRTLQLSGDKLSKSTFDLRNSKMAGNFAGQISKQTGVSLDLGKGGKGGFAEKREEYIKGKVSYAKSLNREDLTEEKALEEYKKKYFYSDEEKQRNLNKELELTNKLEAESNLEKREEIKKEIAQHTKLMADKAKRQDSLEKAGAKDKFGNLVQTDDAIAARKAITEERKKAFQEDYAKSVEQNRTFSGRAHNKGAADKIRKDVVKGESDQDKMFKMLKKQYEKEQKEKEKVASTTTPPTPTT